MRITSIFDLIHQSCAHETKSQIFRLDVQLLFWPLWIWSDFITPDIRPSHQALKLKHLTMQKRSSRSSRTHIFLPRQTPKDINQKQSSWVKKQNEVINGQGWPRMAKISQLSTPKISKSSANLVKACRILCYHELRKKPQDLFHKFTPSVLFVAETKVYWSIFSPDNFPTPSTKLRVRHGAYGSSGLRSVGILHDGTALWTWREMKLALVGFVKWFL